MLDADTTFFVCDTETTGLNVEEGDRMVQFALVGGTANAGITTRFEAKIDTEGRQSSPDSYRIHRIASDHPDRRPEAEVLREVLALTQGEHVVFHNGKFDLGFIDDALTRRKLGPHFWTVFDTMTMARERLPGSGLSLDQVARRLNVDAFMLERRKTKHDGLEDCELAFEVFRRLQFPTAFNLEPQRASSPLTEASSRELIRTLDF
jgi:DNA polymerase-3 subunit epsilon